MSKDILLKAVKFFLTRRMIHQLVIVDNGWIQMQRYLLVHLIEPLIYADPLRC